ncbi:MAG: tripartite tricarboxylate transporter substrate binding protein [Rhodospirillales bacterium]|nr:tripartite tricarboxylate transporter substrate binding protein [Rhodospirillales bacterium]
MINKTVLSIATAAALALIVSGGVQAANWPDEEKVITVIVPYGAGGGTDTAFRPLIEAVKKHLSARIQVANIGGAGGSKGTNELLSRPNDGYTLLAAGTHTIGATMQGLTPGYEQLEHIVGLNWDPFIIAALKSRPYKNMKEMIAAAKAKPGSICLGNAGMGGATGVASVAINLQFGKVFNVTPFKGGKNLRADVLGGRCEVGIFSQSEILANQDVLQPLVILYHEHSRLDPLKSVPTLKEAGFGMLSVPGGSFKSVAVRAGTPAEVRDILADAFEKAFKSDLYQNFMTEKGVIPTFTKLSDTAGYFDELIEGFEPVIREAGLYRKK